MALPVYILADDVLELVTGRTIRSGTVVRPLARDGDYWAVEWAGGIDVVPAAQVVVMEDGGPGPAYAGTRPHPPCAGAGCGGCGGSGADPNPGERSS